VSMGGSILILDCGRVHGCAAGSRRIVGRSKASHIEYSPPGTAGATGADASYLWTQFGRERVRPQCIRSLRRLVNRFATDNGAQDTGVQDLLRIGLERVAVEDNNICEKAGLKTPLGALAELGEGGGLGVGVDSFGQRDPLLWLIGSCSGLILASDRRVESPKGIDRLDRIVSRRRRASHDGQASSARHRSIWRGRGLVAPPPSSCPSTDERAAWKR
jgi:hypothetical protein